MNYNSTNHNDNKEVIHLPYSIKTIRGVIPALSNKYSEEEIRDIAIESHIGKKVQQHLSIISKQPK